MEIRTTTVTLTTQQVEKVHRKSSTQIPERYREVIETLEKFDAKSAVESIRESTQSTTTNISGTLTTSASGSALGGSVAGSASANRGDTYQNHLKSFYKTTGEVENFKSKQTVTTAEVTLSPGDEWIVYTNTTSGGSYSYSWDTTEKLSEASARPVTVEITVTYDLTPVFDEMCATVVDVNNGIGNSGTKSNWIKYANICLDARTKGIRHYIREVQKQLNSDEDFDDDYSWRMVKEAARTADQTSNDAIALSILLGGFPRITQPSKDVWAWGKLKAVSRKFLYQKS
jgi:hypothetical protein